MHLKDQLQNKENYACHYAAMRCSQMLAGYHKGIYYELAIGSEQGIPKWDDFVIEHNKDLLEHIQVKRQTTSISKDDPQRDKVNEGKENKKDRELTSFDESIKALAEWSRLINPELLHPKRIFKVIVPELSFFIKKDLRLQHLADFIFLEIKSTTTAEGLKAIEGSGTYKNLFSYLRSYCSFDDHDHIIRAFRHLEVQAVGYETNLEAEAISHLKYVFDNPSEVYYKVYHYLKDNGGTTKSITTRGLLGVISTYLRADLGNWTQYWFSDKSWYVSGTQDTSSDEMERPPFVVKGFWDSNSRVILKITTPLNQDDQVALALSRMALHAQALCASHLVDRSGWYEFVKNKIGGTYGSSESDFDLMNISVADCSGHYLSPENRKIEGIGQQESEANNLIVAMNQIVLEKVFDKIFQKLKVLPSSDFRDFLEKRMQSWEVQLRTEISKAFKLFCSFLHPNSEGNEINGSLRLGLKTIDLVTQAMFLLLVSSVALSEIDKGWEKIDGILDTKVIGLQYWSGPTGSKDRSPRKLSYNTGRDLLAKEPGRILILSQVEYSNTVIFEQLLGHSTSDKDSLAHGHSPQVLITMTPELYELMENGDLIEIKSYFSKLISKS